MKIHGSFIQQLHIQSELYSYLKEQRVCLIKDKEMVEFSQIAYRLKNSVETDDWQCHYI
jgi:hypothetical protein